MFGNRYSLSLDILLRQWISGNVESTEMFPVTDNGGANKPFITVTRGAIIRRYGSRKTIVFFGFLGCVVEYAFAKRVLLSQG